MARQRGHEAGTRHGMARTLLRFLPHTILVWLFASAAATSVLTARALPLPRGADDYNSPGFIVRYSWTKFAFLAVEPLRDDLSRSEEDTLVERFFELNRRIAADERIAVDPASERPEADAAADRARAERGERARIENRVERILEGRLTDAIKRAGLTRDIGRGVVWPAVAIEFEEPPSVLVRSPRDEIRKESESLLKGDLPIERVQRIERDAERDGRTSALVIRIGAIAMYPAIIPPSGDYHATVDTIAHEWLHHYLFFTPLGRRYYQDAPLTTLNETLADLGGRELACLIDPCAGAADAPRDPAGDAFDFVAEMRGLRRQVETLLADGKIDDAERLMEDTRREIVAHGYYIRRLNQAYFAFHGSYATSAGSIDPIGPKLQALRDRSGSIEHFIETAREFRSEADLDATLDAAR